MPQRIPPLKQTATADEEPLMGRIAQLTPDSETGGRRVLLGLAGRALAELRGARPEGALLESLSHPQLRTLDLAPGDRLYVAAFADDRQLLLIGRLDIGPCDEPERARSGDAAVPVGYRRRVPHEHARALGDAGGRGLRFARAAEYELHPAALMRPFELDADSAGRLDTLLPEPQPLPVPPPATVARPAAPPMPPKPPSARAQAMAQLRAQGHALEQIGRREHTAILAHYRDGRDTNATAAARRAPRAAVRQLVAQRAAPADRAARSEARADASSGRGKTYSDQQLTAAVADVAERLGRTPTAADYACQARALGLPSVPTIQNRLGWTAAVQAAGLIPLAAPRREYRRHWTHDACWTAMRQAVAELGRIPTVQVYESHAAGRADLPSSGTLRNRLGRWSDVCLALDTEAAGTSEPADPATGTAEVGATGESANIKTSQLLTPGEVWTRERLCDLFGISDATVRTGIFRPAGHDSVWLFVSRDKDAGQTQYRDELVGDTLIWDGQTEGRKDHLIIEHAKRGLEVLLFYRASRREHPGAGFTYHGLFAYESHSGSRPASFILRRTL